MDLGTLLSTAAPTGGQSLGSVISTLQNNPQTTSLLNGLNTQMTPSNQSALLNFFEANKGYLSTAVEPKGMEMVSGIKTETIVSICSMVGGVIGLALGGAAPIGAAIGAVVGFAIVGFVKYVLPLFAPKGYQSAFQFCNDTFKKNNEKKIRCDEMFRILGPKISTEVVWIVIKVGENAEKYEFRNSEMQGWFAQMKSEKNDRKQNTSAYWMLDCPGGFLGFMKAISGLNYYNYIKGTEENYIIDLFNNNNMNNEHFKSLCREYPFGMQYLSFVKMRAPDPDHVANMCENAANTYTYIRDVIKKGPYVPPPPPNKKKEEIQQQLTKPAEEEPKTILGIDEKKAPVYFGALGLSVAAAASSYAKPTSIT